MLLSMTGFGKGTADNQSKKFTVEIKSLNSKQLDLSSRIPSAYREMELEMRNVIAARIERGKIDMSLYVETTGEETEVIVNTPLMASYKKQIEQMARDLSIPEPADWYSVLMRFPDAMHSDTIQEASESDKAAIAQALDNAVAQLIEFRAKEGKKLEDFFSIRIQNIRELLSDVPRHETERITKIRARIEEALEKIPHAEYDRGRLEQEMIFYIEKLDISEEKQRLTQHLDYFTETMQSKPGQGKKLGFIAQEMGREINTLGSKSNHAEMQILVVKMKDELEQIKEQVLNVL